MVQSLRLNLEMADLDMIRFLCQKIRKSLGQMDINFKNQISHRGLAMKEFKKFLEDKYENLNN